ncbi:Phosphotyrosyl phosphatase activator [Ramicandelaber brevisporus]|nr:Phosphotyrosyl phosphatase activator [Ramicandelaber brevisporus]KAI8869245.1 Phosphotyrosyl phosphatase activator [Ramicandelaber brevisporus]
MTAVEKQPQVQQSEMLQEQQQEQQQQPSLLFHNEQVASVDKQHVYHRARKQILTPADLSAFNESPAINLYLGFITRLNIAVVGRKTRDTSIPQSPAIGHILNGLDAIIKICKDTPPVQDGLSRFGNAAFRTFYDNVGAAYATLFAPIFASLSGSESGLVRESRRYFMESLGSRKRIDYGTGHEMNFMHWLLVLDHAGAFASDHSDDAALVLLVFFRYIDMMRELQKSYWLEPAGSHGVWGLDDYHMLPFLFGAGQLRDHPHLRPKAIHNPEIVDEMADDYMYLKCIQFVNSVKTESLRWHSPMLDDISSAKSWAKINDGLIKMYRAEVLQKLPIMQHCLFGSVLVFCGSNPDGAAVREEEYNADVVSDAEDDPSIDYGDEKHDHGGEGGHKHTHGTDQECDMDHVFAHGQQFPICCGIKIPSAMSASNTNSKLRSLNVYKAIPFD